MKEYKYLRYMFQKNGGQEAQVKEWVKRGQCMGKGDWRFGENWSKRI